MDDGARCEDCGHLEHNDGECSECFCGVRVRGVMREPDDPFERCYVHAGGLPRVDMKPTDSGTRLLLTLAVNVCALCRSVNTDEAIRARLEAQYQTAAGMIGRLRP